MKPAPFAWHGPQTVAAALDLLAEHADEAKVLAGGQSLLPILAMRLAAPQHVVDINRVDGLGDIAVESGGVRIGALARHRQVERHPGVRAALPLLGQALALVAHPTIRNRGTVVGSLAHADPAAELTTVLALLGGSVTAVARESGERTIAAADFFAGPLESALRPDELAVSAFFPRLPEGTGTAFVEVARRHGDYALCGVAAAVGVGTDGGIDRVRCGYLAVADVPVAVDLTDEWRDDPVTGRAAAAAARAAVDPPADLHASADYRRHLTGVLTVRAIRQAEQHAAGVARAA